MYQADVKTGCGNVLVFNTYIKALLLPTSVFDSVIYFSNLCQQNQPFTTLLRTVNGKVVTVHAKMVQWESKGITPPILNIQTLMEVNDQLHDPAALLRAKNISTH